MDIEIVSLLKDVLVYLVIGFLVAFITPFIFRKR